jgi:hypothetical protein
MNYLAQAIYNLCEGAEFTFQEQDYSTVTWIKLNGDAPSKSQIDAEIAKIKSDEKASVISKDAAKSSALAKLAALGLTADEVASILA